MLAKAVATESGANFVNIAMSSIGSKVRACVRVCVPASVLVGVCVCVCVFGRRLVGGNRVNGLPGSTVYLIM